MSKVYDAIIIGAGPAGSSAALEIASGGFNVLMLSKYESPGKNKACAGGLPLALATRLKLPDSIIEKRINGFHTFSSDFPEKIKTFDYPKCVTVYRRNLDPFLAQRVVDLGAELISDITAYKVLRKHDIVIVSARRDDGTELEYRAKMIVFADGINSLAKESCDIGIKKEKINSMATYAYELDAPRNSIDNFEIYYDLKKVPWGHFWMAPKKDRIIVGLACVAEKSLPPFKELLTTYISSSPSLKGISPLIKRERGGEVPLYVNPQKIFSDRALVCGDAAGLVNSITFSGLPYAVKSGELAGITAVRAIRKGDFTKAFLSSYSRSLLRRSLFLWIHCNGKIYERQYFKWQRTGISGYAQMQTKYLRRLSWISRFIGKA